MKRFCLLIGIPFLLAGCFNGASTRPPCADCDDLSPTNQPETSATGESNTDPTDTNVENPVRSLGGSGIGGAGETVADDPPERPEPDEETELPPLTDSELNALIEGIVVPGEDLAGTILVPSNPTDPGDSQSLGLVDRWGFPLFDQVVDPDILLDIFIEGLSFGLLPPDPSDRVNPSGFTQLELQCIAQGEPEFICRQRYGR